MKDSQKITMAGLLHEALERHGDREALVFPDTGFRQTYAEFYQDCQAVAKGFMALGVQKGDRVSVWTSNLPEWVHLQFGLGMIGAVLVTVNTNYKAGELEYILAQSDSTTLVLMEGYRDTSYYEMVREIAPELKWSPPGKLKSDRVPFLKNVVYIGRRKETPGMFSLSEVLRYGRSVTDQALLERGMALNPHDVITMQYTSGTTGFPKGVMLTHQGIINNARMVGDVLGLTPEDRLLIHVPLFHCFGCVTSTLNCVIHGSAMVILEGFDAYKALKVIEQEKCTAINGVPTMFIGMLNHPEFERYDYSSLRTGIVAGAPCPAELLKMVQERLHCPEIAIAFGLTENSPVMTMTRRDDPLEIRVSTVGRPLPGIEGRIVDPITGRVLPPGIQGEIVTRSPCVMRGYYKMPEASLETIDEDGWLHTGDLGILDEQGYFKITGRIKEMIIRGGENIYPREIEEFLHHHPKVSDVYVVGVPDHKYGEQVLAVIRLQEGQAANADDLFRFCRGKIARHKIPDYWEFVESFPVTANGKVQKFKLIEQFVNKYAA